jgi:hypothetical protein
MGSFISKIQYDVKFTEECLYLRVVKAFLKNSVNKMLRALQYSDPTQIAASPTNRVIMGRMLEQRYSKPKRSWKLDYYIPDYKRLCYITDMYASKMEDVKTRQLMEILWFHYMLNSQDWRSMLLDSVELPTSVSCGIIVEAASFLFENRFGSGIAAFFASKIWVSNMDNIQHLVYCWKVHPTIVSQFRSHVHSPHDHDNENHASMVPGITAWYNQLLSLDFMKLMSSPQRHESAVTLDRQGPMIRLMVWFTLIVMDIKGWDFNDNSKKFYYPVYQAAIKDSGWISSSASVSNSFR